MVDLNADGYDDLLLSKRPETPTAIGGSTAVSWYAGSPTGLFAAPNAILPTP